MYVHHLRQIHAGLKPEQQPTRGQMDVQSPSTVLSTPDVQCTSDAVKPTQDSGFVEAKAPQVAVAPFAHDSGMHVCGKHLQQVSRADELDMSQEKCRAPPCEPYTEEHNNAGVGPGMDNHPSVKPQQSSLAKPDVEAQVSPDEVVDGKLTVAEPGTASTPEDACNTEHMDIEDISVRLAMQNNEILQQPASETCGPHASPTATPNNGQVVPGTPDQVANNIGHLVPPTSPAAAANEVAVVLGTPDQVANEESSKNAQNSQRQSDALQLRMEVVKGVHRPSDQAHCHLLARAPHVAADQEDVQPSRHDMETDNQQLGGVHMAGNQDAGAAQ